MSKFSVHTVETAPEGSKIRLEGSLKALKFIPNLHGVLAESPSALAAYQDLTQHFSATSLSKVEQNVVWMTINYENNCHYCIPAHSMIAKGAGVPEDEIENLREGRPLNDAKLQALKAFTVLVVQNHGVLTDAQTNAFIAAGFTKENILDVIVGVAHKTISNYTNHFANTDIDAPFKHLAWTHPDERAENS